MDINMSASGQDKVSVATKQTNKQNRIIKLLYDTNQLLKQKGLKDLKFYKSVAIKMQIDILLEIFVDFGYELEAENMSMGKTERSFWGLGKLSDL